MIMRRSRAAALLVLALLLVGTLLGGCARVRAALAVQPDDTVTGELVFATPAKSADDKGPTVTLPPDLASDVDVTAYRQDGYTGSLLRFSRLSFAQTAALTHATFPANDRVQFTLRRAGGRVLVTGSVDLTTVSVDKADFQLKMSFPGRVVDANGEIDGGTVSWTFTPGEVGDVSATVAYADPGAPSVLNWTLALAGAVALLALTVVLAARRARNPPVSPPVR
jgi:LppM domain